MPSITSLVMGQLETLQRSYQENVVEPKYILSKLRERLLQENYIFRFDRLPDDQMKQKSMVCIDGGNTLNSYQVGDLIVTGASVGEGYLTKKLYDEETLPSEVFAELVPHLPGNDRLGTTIRALQELRILARTQDADYRIIDGGYLGNTSEVIFQLLNNDKRIVEQILSQNFYDSDGYLRNGLNEILSPTAQTMGKIIAVVKSDSKTVYAKLFKEKFGIDVGMLTDRMIADSILEPGEMLTPRWLDSNPMLIDALKKKHTQPNFYDKVGDKLLLQKLTKDNITKLEMLRTTEHDNTLEGVLWATYFKPHVWSKNDKSIHIEYPFFRSNPYDYTYQTFAQYMAGVVDSDIHEPAILEPWCQWIADREAKKVSEATRIAQLALENSMSAEDLYRLQSYRT